MATVRLAGDQALAVATRRCVVHADLQVVLFVGELTSETDALTDSQQVIRPNSR
jgi:hypothetical protein